MLHYFLKPEENTQNKSVKLHCSKLNLIDFYKDAILRKGLKQLLYPPAR